MSRQNEWSRYLALMDERPECFQNTGPIYIVKDWTVIEEYQQRTGKTIGVCYESEYNIFVVDLVYEHEGEFFCYERILPATPKGSVVCVPEYNSQYILLKQYRHSMRDYQYAFPRGYAAPELTGEQNACKEIEEELGAKVTKTRFLGSVVADSGLSGQTVEIYVCYVESYQNHYGYEGIVETYIASEDELVQMIRNNKITDGFTLAAYCYLVSAKRTIEGTV